LPAVEGLRYFCKQEIKKGCLSFVVVVVVVVVVIIIIVIIIIIIIIIITPLFNECST